MLVNSKELEVEFQDSLLEVNLGTKQKKRITYVSAELRNCDQTKMAELLNKYRDCFAWDYDEFPGFKGA